MKGIVADIKGKNIVVLSKDGRFLQMRNNGLYQIGCEIDIKEQPGMNMRMLTRVASMAAVAMFVLGLGYGAYSYTVPYSYVDMDINPSIELTANVFDRIINAEGLNEDGKKLLLSDSLKHSTLDKGIADLLDKAVKQGYLKQETLENAVVFTVLSNDSDKSAKLGKKLSTAVNAELKAEGVETELVVESASREEYDNAREIGMTPGKLNLIKKAIEAKPELKLEDLKDASVKDIMKQIKQTRQEDKQEIKRDKQETKQDKQQDKQEQKQDKNDKKQDTNSGKQDETTLSSTAATSIATDKNKENDKKDKDKGKPTNSENGKKNEDNSISDETTAIQEKTVIEETTAASETEGEKDKENKSDKSNSQKDSKKNSRD